MWQNEEHYDEVFTKNITLNFMDDEASVTSLLQKTDILMFIGLYDFNLNMIERFKSVNPNGKIYLKLDLNRYWLNRITFNDRSINLLSNNSLVSVESKI